MSLEVQSPWPLCLAAQIRRPFLRAVLVNAAPIAVAKTVFARPLDVRVTQVATVSVTPLVARPVPAVKPVPAVRLAQVANLVAALSGSSLRFGTRH